MGGGSPGWWWSDYHNWDWETRNAINSRNIANQYRNNANYALDRIYRELDQEQTRIQTTAFRDAANALFAKKDIEWKIFEQEVKKAQANYISGLYTNRILLELNNLDDIVKAK